jgi:hypothetical protein
MLSRGNGWQTPFSTAGSGHTLDVRRALDSPIHRPDRRTRKRLRVNSVHKKEKKPGPLQGSDGVGLLQRSSHQSGTEKSPRSWYGGTRHPGSETSAEPGSWALDRTYLPRQAEATQERCRSWRTRISTSTPSPISWSVCGTRFSSPCPASASELCGWRFTSATKTPIGKETNSGFRGQRVVWCRHSGEVASR